MDFLKIIILEAFLCFPPYHFVDYTYVALDDIDDIGADVFVYAGDEETAFVEGLGTFGGGADASRGNQGACILDCLS